MLEKRIESGTIEEHQLNPDQQLWDRTEPTAATPTVSLKDGWSLYAKNYDDRLNLIEDYIVLLSGNMNVYSETRTRMVYINNTSNTYYLTFVNGGTAYPVNPAETVKCWWDGSVWRTDHTFKWFATADGSSSVTIPNTVGYNAEYNLVYTRASSGARTITLPTAVGNNRFKWFIQIIGTGSSDVSLAFTSSQTLNGKSTWTWKGTGKLSGFSDNSNWQTESTYTWDEYVSTRMRIEQITDYTFHARGWDYITGTATTLTISLPFTIDDTYVGNYAIANTQGYKSGSNPSKITDLSGSATERLSMYISSTTQVILYCPTAISSGIRLLATYQIRALKA